MLGGIRNMSTKWTAFTMRLVVSVCFLAEGIFAKSLHHAMYSFTFAHYLDLGEMKFELFPIQDCLEILYRGLLVLSLLWLFLALKLVIRLPKNERAS